MARQVLKPKGDFVAKCFRARLGGLSEGTAQLLRELMIRKPAASRPRSGFMWSRRGFRAPGPRQVRISISGFKVLIRRVQIWRVIDWL
jgi:hypothetical protein